MWSFFKHSYLAKRRDFILHVLKAQFSCVLDWPSVLPKYWASCLWMEDWLLGWLQTHWFTVCLSEWIADWFFDWQINCPFHWLKIDQLIYWVSQLIYSLSDWFTGWFIDWQLVWTVDWLVSWFTEWVDTTHHITPHTTHIINVCRIGKNYFVLLLSLVFFPNTAVMTGQYSTSWV
jgi:hypothetical protein